MYRTIYQVTFHTQTSSLAHSLSFPVLHFSLEMYVMYITVHYSTHTADKCINAKGTLTAMTIVVCSCVQIPQHISDSSA